MKTLDRNRNFKYCKIILSFFTTLVFLSLSCDLKCDEFQGKQKSEINDNEIFESTRDIHYIIENIQNVDSLYALGKFHARQDLIKGKYIIKYVFNPGQTFQYFDILKNDYNIILDPVSDGFLSNKESAYYQGYNSISISEIKKQFGEDVLEKAKSKVKVWFDIEPKLIKKAKLEYPKEAVKNGLEGRVVVRILLDKNGNPKQAKVIMGDEIFHDAAINMAMQSTYSGGTTNGVPSDIWVSMPVEFKIN